MPSPAAEECGADDPSLATIARPRADAATPPDATAGALPRSVLITGAAGYIGSRLVAELAREPRSVACVVAADLRAAPESRRSPAIEYLAMDVRSSELERVLRERRIEAVVHLASVVNPGPRMSRETQHDIDVAGTENVLRCCVAAGVRKIVVTSSGAAYGYHPDNPQPLVEEDALRGNAEFAYSDHKRQVELILARYRREHPELRQVVLRLCTVLGPGVSNQIVSLFEKPVILAVAGAQAPFVFVSDRDVVASIFTALRTDSEGVYNLAGDGAMTLAEIAARTGKRCIAVPPALLRAALGVLHPLGLVQYGPEQVAFLRHRPVLSNAKAKAELGFVPTRTSREAFDEYWRARGRDFAGKTVLITGAAGGIGSALADRFADGGATLALVDRDAQAAEALAERLRRTGTNAAAFGADVGRAADCEAAVHAAIERFGGIDVLVNNAGITHLSRFADTEPAVLRKVMDVDFFGAAYCTRAALESLLARRGSVVVVSSVAGFAPLAGRAGYAAAKHALHGLFDTLRAEHARDGLHVLLVCPGFTRTGIEAAALGGDGGRATAARTTFGRMAEPRDVADAICRGVLNRRRTLVLGVVAKTSFGLTRIAPALYDRLMARSLKPSRRRS